MMKKKIILLIMIICVALTACRSTEADIKQDILFVYYEYHGNHFACGYYIDNKGMKYEFRSVYVLDECGIPHGEVDGRYFIQVIENLTSVELGKGKKILSDRDVEKCYEYLYKIDLECDYSEEKIYRVDGAGSRSLCGVVYDSENNISIVNLFCASGKGGVVIRNNDENAKKIVKTILQKEPIVAEGNIFTK